MAQVIWTEPALAELDAIADYIALDNPDAAKNLVRHIFERTDQLERFPKLGSRVPEFPKSTYRQLTVKPCRIFYRVEGQLAVISFVMRSERLLRRQFLE